MKSPHRHPTRIVTFVLAFLATSQLVTDAASAATLDRVRQNGKIILAYRTDARPFSYRDESGNAAGYSIDLCQQIVDQVKSKLQMPSIAAEWVPVSVEDQFRAVQEGKVDVLCAAASETLTRRKDVSFSVPIFFGGIGALLRTDAPAGLKEVLSGRRPTGPLWRGYPATVLEKQTFSVVAGTTSEIWLARKLNQFQLTATVIPVQGYDAGVRRVVERSSNVFFGDRAILLDAAKRSPSSHELTVLERQFTYEPLALALARDDEDFRLLVDQTLVHFFSSEEFRSLHTKWFGEPDETAMMFFKMNMPPD